MDNYILKESLQFLLKDNANQKMIVSEIMADLDKDEDIQ